MDDYLVYKLILASAVVVGLSFVAEHVSPKWAGVLLGLPTGTAITLYFYGLQHGVEFAGQSAIYNMLGLIAMQMFILGYYLIGRSAKKFNLFFSIAGGVVCYSISIVGLSFIPASTVIAITLPLASFVFFGYLFRRIPSLTITKKIKVSFAIIIARAVLAALIISVITGVAYSVGHKWAGFFSAFPSTLFPLIVIIHLSYGEEFTHSIIKHVPDGLVGLLVYSLVLYLGYPSLNLYQGIMLGFVVTAMYIMLYRIVSNMIHANLGGS